MKNIKFNILSLLLGTSIMTFTSCTSEVSDEVFDSQSNLLQIKTDIKTRSVITGSEFSANEQIGIYALKENDSEYASRSSNLSAAYKGDGYWEQDFSLPLTNETAYIYAYYPYDQYNESTTVNINITPYARKEIIPGQVDYLYGQYAKVNASNPVAQLSFKHALARITLAIKRSANDAGSGALSQVCLRNVPGNNAISTSGTMDITTGRITPEKNENAAIILTDNYNLTTTVQNVDILVMPIEIADNEVEVALTIDGSLYITKLPNANWEAGKQYTYPITINRKTAPNADPLAKIGDYYYNDGTYSTSYNPSKDCIGIVFALSNEKDGDIDVTLQESEHGRIVALNDLEGEFTWIDADYTDVEGIPNCTTADGYYSSGFLPVDGYENYLPDTDKEHIQSWNLNNWPTRNGKDYGFTDYAGKQHASFLMNDIYPAAMRCDPSREGFWYLPSIGEMARLGMVYSAQMINSSKQDPFRNFHESANYWTSSEYNEKTAWRYTPSNAYVGQYNKQSKLRVRPIASF